MGWEEGSRGRMWLRPRPERLLTEPGYVRIEIGIIIKRKVMEAETWGEGSVWGGRTQAVEFLLSAERPLLT